MITVTAGIIEKEGKVLIAQRQSEPSLWEFPGGKLKKSETIMECLKREIKEELNIEICPQEVIEKSIFKKNGKIYELIGIKADFISGDISLSVHSAIKWVYIENLKNYEFMLPDMPIVEKLLIKR